MDRIKKTKQVVRAILEEIQKLRQLWMDTQRMFTIDGNLVGDLGEVLVAACYQVELETPGAISYDGMHGIRRVEIKATCKPGNPRVSIQRAQEGHHETQALIVVRIDPKEPDCFKEIYNGPINLLLNYNSWTGRRLVSVRQLEQANRGVQVDARILRRNPEG